jgi:hypothetical protein
MDRTLQYSMILRECLPFCKILRKADVGHLLIASVLIFAVRRTEVIDSQTLVFSVAFVVMQDFELHLLGLQESFARLRRFLSGVPPRYPFLLWLLCCVGILTFFFSTEQFTVAPQSFFSFHAAIKKKKIGPAVSFVP